MGDDVWRKQGRRSGPGLDLLLFSIKRKEITPPLSQWGAVIREVKAPQTSPPVPFSQYAVTQARDLEVVLTAPQAHPHPHS